MLFSRPWHWRQIIHEQAAAAKAGHSSIFRPTPLHPMIYIFIPRRHFTVTPTPETLRPANNPLKKVACLIRSLILLPLLRVPEEAENRLFLRWCVRDLTRSLQGGRGGRAGVPWEGRGDLISKKAGMKYMKNCTEKLETRNLRSVFKLKFTFSLR